MDDETKAHYETKAGDLRADLKRWESAWAQTHGSKPGRQDIKDNPDIGAHRTRTRTDQKEVQTLTGTAQKYKDYNRVRDVLAGRLPPDEPRSRKRKPDPVPPSQTPVKRARHLETPSKSRPDDEGLMNTPAISRKLFSPASVKAIGPTPQKDGRVLGLFDLLVERELGTPSRKASSPTADGRPHVLATPSKRSAADDDADARLGRTPMSTSKRQLLNTFMTPLKRRRPSDAGGTPTSASKLQFDTPAFLKRHSLPTVDETATFDAPALRLPRKPLVRGLSEIVASLRKVEEEVLDNDDDMDALREVEDAENGVERPPAPPKPVTAPEEAPALLGGLDDEALYDSPVEDAVDRNGNPLPVYKKKGQKRTTRKANMRPVRAKRPADMAEHGGEAPGADGSEDEYTGADAVKRTKQAARKEGHKEGPKEGAVRKTVRKVNELAHANFQRLKLRNSGAKGGPGYNSRFRRKR
ncbi:DNA replication regulator SLD2 [Purpureocillium lavendulum]|uniref:DNA replication regulator SLD2 n=1 Tax=Purpureocillium lavendulum TaxID=1247861 RepID=A0AB34FQ69_9HYPO|nr:DNA replication regulator SLD2 [Purpureocillium lavendulum]